MGLIQRSVESAGMATISVSLSKDITEKLRPPRALFVNFPLGHPMGYPRQVSAQRRMLRLLLKYLKEIDSPGTIFQLDVSGKDAGASYPD